MDRYLNRLSLMTLIMLFALLSCNRQNRELSETLQWMDNTYNPHENWSTGHGQTGFYSHDTPGDSHESLVTGVNETFTHNGCQMTVCVKQNPLASGQTEMYSNSVYDFSLGDIDPKSIKLHSYSRLGGFVCDNPETVKILQMDCDHSRVQFNTHAEAPLIRVLIHTTFPQLQGKDHESRKTEKDNEAFFWIDNPEYANRFKDAFRRAVELCGGKPMSF